MNKYVIIASSVGTMGGEQIHNWNKYLYCTNNGYAVYIISAFYGDVVIEELKQFESYVVEELDFFPTMFTKSARTRVINKILNMIEYSLDDNVIIESHMVCYACWAEILAAEIQGKNFIHLMGEKFSINATLRVKDFLEFKYERRELATIGRAEIMQNLFKPFRTLSLDECYPLSAVSNNDAEDVPIPDRINLGKRCDKVIGIAGRLEKPFVKTSFDEVISLASDNPTVTFKIVLIGYGNIDKLLQKAEQHKNIEIVYTGMLYPIPRKLFQICDICISSSGTARIAGRYAITVSIDAVTDKAIGILGYDTNRTLISDNANASSLREYLELVLFTNFKDTANYNLLPPEDLAVLETRLKDHMEFVDNSAREKNYYDFFNKKRDVMDHIASLSYSVLGIKGINALRNIRHALKQTIKMINN